MHHTWTVDTVPPVVAITSGPADGAVRTSTGASFAFTTNELGTVWCSLDGVAAAVCASPMKYAGLALGPHTFTVFARDRAGNASAPVTRSWTVVPP